MSADLIPLIIAGTIFLAGFISLRVGVSVAVVEILLGVIIGNCFGVKPQEWMIYLASFGGILLTFLAGAEIDSKIMKEKFKESFLLGITSFLSPFVIVFLYTFYALKWTFPASLISGVALSCTSLAVVYSVLVETGLSGKPIGKLLMASTFITNFATALTLSILFTKGDWKTLLFVVISIIIIVIARRFSVYILLDRGLKDKVVEPEIKYIFFLLFALMYFANFAHGQAILPAFIMGALMARHFRERSMTKKVKNRLRTVAYAIITPLFFIVNGMRISFSLILGALSVFSVLFLLKVCSKFLGVYFMGKKYIPDGNMYVSLLMSTGLTFGNIAALFGYNAGFIDTFQYSIVQGVIIVSAVIPTFIAQKWYMPVEMEDLLDVNGNGNKNNIAMGK